MPLYGRHIVLYVGRVAGPRLDVVRIVVVRVTPVHKKADRIGVEYFRRALEHIRGGKRRDGHFFGIPEMVVVEVSYKEIVESFVGSPFHTLSDILRDEFPGPEGRVYGGVPAGADSGVGGGADLPGRNDVPGDVYQHLGPVREDQEGALPGCRIYKMDIQLTFRPCGEGRADSFLGASASRDDYRSVSAALLAARNDGCQKEQGKGYFVYLHEYGPNMPLTR